MPLVALDEEHFVHRRVFLEPLEARREAWITESSSRPVIGEETTVHCGVNRLQGVPWLNDEDGAQIGGVARVELGAELKVAGK